MNESPPTARAVMLLAAFVLLHRIDGGEVFINPALVVSLNARAGASNKVLTKQAECAIGLSNGKLVSVLESCARVKQLLDEESRK